MIVYIPRGSEHEIRCISQEELGNIYVAIWPKGIDPSVHTNACPSKKETQEWYLRGNDDLWNYLPLCIKVLENVKKYII